jgi:hypothetical protein
MNRTVGGLVASFVMHLFEKLFGVGLSNAPQLSMVLRNITRTLIPSGLTMSEIPLLLSDETVREKLTAHLTNPQQLFWQEYNRKPPGLRADLVASTANKFDAFLSDPLIRNIVSQRSAIPWRRLMDERAIVLITLSGQHEEASRLVGTAVLGQLLMASFSRMGAAYCPEFHVYADEWQNLVTSDVATWIHEARKGHCVLHLANQSLSQLSPEIQQAALSAGALVVFRVGAGEDAKTLAQSFDHTPAAEIRAPVADVVGHLLRRGHSHEVVSQFTTEYLRSLEALIRIVGGDQHEFALGCTYIRASHLIEGQRLINACLYECMRTGRADGFIQPLALLILGGGADPRSTYVLKQHIRTSVSDGYVLKGFYASANQFGRPGFRSEKGLTTFLASYTRPGLLRRLFGLSRKVPDSVTAFVRFLRSFREVMEILAKQPVLVDTGESPAAVKPRSFADAENMLAMELARMDNYICRLKISSGEHLIRTYLAPQGLSDASLAARLQAVKERMLERGLCRYAKDVEKEVAERHEALRRPDDERPRRRRDAEPLPPAHG